MGMSGVLVDDSQNAIGTRGYRAWGALAAIFLLAALPFAADANDSLPATEMHLLAPLAEESMESQRHPLKDLRWKLGLASQSFTNEQDKAQTVGLGLEGDLRMSPLRMLEIRARAQARLQSGYAQSRFGDNTPANGVRLKEAYLSLRPLTFFTLQAGALDQGLLGSPLLVSEQAFPGVAEVFEFGDERVSVEFRAQQVVPASSNLSTKSIESEPTPSLTTESLVFRFSPGHDLEFKTSATHFSFKSLPSAVATESDRYGNTVVDAQTGIARFQFEYEGYVLGGEAKARVAKDWVVEVDAQILNNTKARDNYRRGQQVGMEMQISLPEDIELRPRGEIFFAESDVAPAFYNSSQLGHTNRQGWSGQMTLAFKQQKFQIGALYVESDVINPNSMQSRQSFILLNFETFYEAI